MNIIECNQGDATWHAARAKRFCASEAAAAMGLSKYMSRTDLLEQKFTGIIPAVDANKQRLFDAGHQAEADARPIVEADIGEELFPCVGTLDVEGLPLLASMDGLTMLGDRAWENKLTNATLRAFIGSGEVPDAYWPQLEQGLLVSGAEKVYFTASDGTEAGTVGIWYESQPVRRAALIAAWKQFAADLATYQHQEVIAAPTVAAIDELPALVVELSGQVTNSNLDVWQSSVRDRIQAINTDLQTDEDFARAKKTVTFLEDGEKKLDFAKSQALAQTSSIDDLFRTVDSLKAEMRAKRLELDKLVKHRETAIKVEIMQEAKGKLVAHVSALGKRIEMALPPVNEDFAGAIKNKRSIASLRGAVDTELARCKIAANEIADLIELNRKAMAARSALFPDFGHVCTKAPDDFLALIAMRVGQEEKRLAEQREAIRLQEEAKAQAKVKAEEAGRQRLLDDANAKVAALAKAEADKAITANQQPAAVAPQIAQVQSQPAPEPDTGATMKLDEICATLGFTLTADFLARLGFHPAATEKNSKLYHVSAFPRICSAIVRHIEAAANIRRAA